MDLGRESKAGLNLLSGLAVSAQLNLPHVSHLSLQKKKTGEDGKGVHASDTILPESQTSSYKKSKKSTSSGDKSADGDGDSDYDSDSNSVGPSTSKKVKWTPLEDSRLKSAIYDHLRENLTDIADAKSTSINWGEVATHVPNRTSKQCRERWCYNLDPNINHGPFSVEEDAILLKAHKKYGNQWATIAKFLPNRTENAVKTRHKSVMRAQRREWKMHEDQTLLSLYKQYGSKWDEMVPYFSKPNRTANAIKTRFSYLKNMNLRARMNEGAAVENEQLEVGNVRQIWLKQYLIDSIDLNYFNKMKESSTPTQMSGNQKVPAQQVNQFQQQQQQLNQVQQENLSQSQQQPVLSLSKADEKLLTGLTIMQEAVMEDNLLNFDDKLQLANQAHSLAMNFLQRKKQRLEPQFQ